jgi:RimJ/RimL family protein N-acetyltransferase
MKQHFNFSLAHPTDQSMIEDWLARPHIREWLHGEGLKTTLQSLAESFEGSSDFQHWIVYDSETPFGYLLTSEIDPQEEFFAAVHFSGDKAITLDVFIGEPDYLGKGFGTAMIKQLIQWQFADVSDVIIDPEVANERAVHVYQKLGFRIIETFIAPWHPVPHYLMHMSGEDLKALMA